MFRSLITALAFGAVAMTSVPVPRCPNTSHATAYPRAAYRVSLHLRRRSCLSRKVRR